MATRHGISEFVYNKKTSPLDWKCWKSVFRAYLGTAELRMDQDADAEAIKHYLIAYVGKHAVETMNTLGPNWESSTLKELMDVLDNRYGRSVGMTNEMIFENLTIEDGEDLEDYIYKCQTLASVAGLNENDIKKKLLKDVSIHNLPEGSLIIAQCLKDDYSLDKLLDWARKQDIKSSIISKSNATLSLNKITRERLSSASSDKSDYSANYNTFAVSQYNQNQNNKRKSICFKCKRRDYPHVGSCPALDKPCFDCQEIGHFKGAKFCRKPSEDTAQQRRESEKRVIRKVSCINIINNKTNPTAKIEISNSKIKFTLDSGADLDIMTSNSVESIHPRPKIYKSSAVLYSFDSNTPLKVIGEVYLEMKWQGQTKIVTFIVVDNNKKNLPNLLSFNTMVDFKVDFNKLFYDHHKNSNHSLPSIQSILSTASHGSKTSASKPHIFSNVIKSHSQKLNERIKIEYADLFEDRTGCVPNVKIKLNIDHNIKPIKVPPRMIPLKLLGGTKQQLDTWEKQNIIQKISYNDLVTYVSALNPIEKPSDDPNNPKVRLTLDCRQVNKAIIREGCTMLPDQHQIEYDLENAKIFSKIDIKDAFSTLQLDDEASMLFTFSTPWGLYRLNRLVQGVNVSSEVYHDFISNEFRDIEFVRTCIDDFLVYGKDDEKDSNKNELARAIELHDIALFKTLDRCRKLNLNLNEKNVNSVRKKLFFTEKKLVR